MIISLDIDKKLEANEKVQRIWLAKAKAKAVCEKCVACSLGCTEKKKIQTNLI